MLHCGQTSKRFGLMALWALRLPLRALELLRLGTAMRSPPGGTCQTAPSLTKSLYLSIDTRAGHPTARSQKVSRHLAIGQSWRRMVKCRRGQDVWRSP